MPSTNTITPGERFDRWTALEEVDNGGKQLCRCDCGITKFVRIDYLRRGRSRSCGCLRNELVSQRRLIHGHTICGTPAHGRTKVYIVWKNMLARCRNPKSDDYRNYGGRGITVCDRWLKFENFLEDMGEPPSGLTIDRSDSNGPYCKENCAWATSLQQGRNRRNVIKLTFNGKTMTMGEWAEQLGVPSRLLTVRYHRGWPIERILTLPLIQWDRRRPLKNNP